MYPMPQFNHLRAEIPTEAEIFGLKFRPDIPDRIFYGKNSEPKYSAWNITLHFEFRLESPDQIFSLKTRPEFGVEMGKNQ